MSGLAVFAFFTNPMELMILAGVLLAIVAPFARAATRRQSLVLRSFDVRCRPQPPGQPLVEIVGRPAGIVAFVLSTLQLQPQTKLSATESGIECETASLFGHLTKFVPLSRVASISAGLHKPVGYLIVAGLLFLVGVAFSASLGSSGLLLLLVATILVVGYFVSKSVLFEIKSNAGIEISLSFRPGVVEGAPIDAEKALAAAGVIRDLILERRPVVRPEAVPIDVGSQFADRFPQSMPPMPPTQHSPPPFVENEPPVVDGVVQTDGAHDEQLAREALREAVRLYKAGNRDAAAAAMSRIIEQYPNTTVAATAQANLTKMRTESR
jgi:hypothetical protein